MYFKAFEESKSCRKLSVSSSTLQPINFYSTCKVFKCKQFTFLKMAILLLLSFLIVVGVTIIALFTKL